MFKKQLRKFKYLCIRLLRIKDKDHSISSGFTVGFLINFIPSFGLGPLLSTIGPKLTKGNSVAGFIGGIAFIWAFPIFFYFNVLVGEMVLPISVETKIDIILDELDEGIQEPQEVLYASIKMGKAFLLGMFINVVIFGAIVYTLIYYLIKKYRKKILITLQKNWHL